MIYCCYPNPFDQTLFIDLYLPKGETLEINILDSNIDEVLRKFKSKYLTSEIGQISDSDDAAVTLEKTNSKKSCQD